MAAQFSPKQVLIDGQAILIDQNSLKIDPGYPEIMIRTQVFGKTVVQVPGQDLTNAKSKISFDMLTLDSDSDKEDVPTLIQTWKQASNGVLITIVPDGAGKNQNFQNMYLTNKVEEAQNPNGTTSFVFEGKLVQLT